MSTRVGGAGGVIVISKDGEMTKCFTTTRMAWASASNGILQSGIDPGKEIVENIID